MKQTFNSIIILDSMESIENSDIQQILNNGICYYKIPDENSLSENLTSLRTDALHFFKDEKISKQDILGYEDRHKPSVAEKSERLSFNVNCIPSALEQQKQSIQSIEEQLAAIIVTPLLEKIFTLVGKPELFGTVMDRNQTYVSLVHYSSDNNHSNSQQLGLKKHKDLGLVTVIALNEPGLTIRTKQDGTKGWQPIEPLDGYFVIMLGKVLQLILGKDRCLSLSHKVDYLGSERLTTGFFFNPVANRPIDNVFTGQNYYDDFGQYLNVKMSKYNSSKLNSH